MNKIESYVDSLIPKNIPKSKQKMLRAEIEAHIFDRIDFYTDIGYDTDASIDKAIADMGEDEEVKSSIRNDFEELHFERTWWAVAVGVVMFIVSSALSFVFEFNTQNLIVLSFVLTFVYIAFTYFIYKKGLRKCLIASSISHFAIELSFLIGFSDISYYLLAQSSFDEVIPYLIELYTPLILYDMTYCIYEWYSLLYIVITLILAFKIKKHGKPAKKKPFIPIAFCVIYLVAAVTSVSLYDDAINHFMGYSANFTNGLDHITVDAQNYYSAVDENTLYSEFSGLLKENGYMTVEEYKESLAHPNYKYFSQHYDNLEFILGEEYEVWVHPDRMEFGNSSRTTYIDDVSYYHQSYYTDISTTSNFIEEESYTLIFLLKDEVDKVKSIGVGQLDKELGYYSPYGEIENYVDIEECFNYFQSLEGGESETEVMNFFDSQHREIVGKYKTYTENGKLECYRLRLHSSLSFEEYDGIDYVELWFENDSLKQGKYHRSVGIVDEYHYVKI